jgi:tetratricopeptide (TPR) repeat protein
VTDSDDVAPTLPAPAGDAAMLSRGDSLDHFIVVDQLGRGGMGVVFAAYDPDLHRKVAIKLLPLDADESGDRATSRLFREAQAMAKLAHPNVATVYEVGVVDDQVFIAMELVDGVTLERWLADTEPSIDETVRVFLAAGRGLAAAHDAGLVHRDFKPSNVMIAKSGRVVVLDFGLARPAPGGAADDDELSDIRGDTTTALDVALTRAGQVVGTPAYMSPEQYLGQAVDERSDQFSFCVSLYEALYSERPFGGATIAELSSEIVEGRVRKPPTDRDVPARVRRVIERGLQRSRKERYESMGSLLLELAPTPPAAPIRLAVAIGVIALAALVAVLVVVQRSKQDGRCAAAETHLAGVWDDDRKAAVLAAFEATGREYAGPTFDAVAVHLDSYAADWVDMRTEACEATSVRGEQSQQLLDLRMQCLDRRLNVLAALTDVFSNAPRGEIVDGALEAVGALADLDACADREALTAVLAPPDDPDIRERVAAIRAIVDEATAANQAGESKRAVALLESAPSRADATGYAPVQAEVQLALGTAYDYLDDFAASEPALRAAARAAAAGRQDDVAARSWTALLGVLSATARYDEAIVLIPVAEAALDRAEAGVQLRARYYDLVGLVYSRSGDYKVAKTWHDRALALVEKEFGERTLEFTKALNHAALIRWRLGELEDAKAMFERQIEIQNEILQPNHPSIAVTLNNLGLVIGRMGKGEDALGYYERAIEIITAVLGEGHLRLANPHENYGVYYTNSGDFELARVHHQKALDVRIENLGEDHPDVAHSLEGLGSVAWYEGKLDVATPYYERSRAIRKAALPPDHPFIAQSTNNLAGLLAMQGKCDEALPLFREALAMREAKLGPDHPDVANSLNDVGNCLLDTKVYDQAAKELERALAIRRDRKVRPVLVADTEMLLGMTLWELGDRARAKSLVKSARAMYLAAKNPKTTYIDQLDGWMRGKGLL